MSIPTAQAKCYLTEDKRLVPDGHKDAKFLFALPGQVLDRKRAESVKNVGDFFDIETGKQKAEKPAAAPEPEKAAPSPPAPEVVIVKQPKAAKAKADKATKKTR